MRPPEQAPPLARAAALGLVQGPAELLPVSSSAHVALLARRLGLGAGDAELRKALEVAAHLGSLLALLPFERRPSRHEALTIATATAVTAAAGALLERPVERHLGGPRATAVGLLLGSLPLVGAARAGARAPRAPLAEGSVLGAAQALALWPGVSRAAMTLAAARALGRPPQAAADLSRRAGLPVLAGAVVLKGARLARSPRALPALAATAAAAALSTAAARPLARLTARRLWPWALYRCALAAALLRRPADRGRGPAPPAARMRETAGR